MLRKIFFCRIPFNYMKMKNLTLLTLVALVVFLGAGCGKGSKSSKGFDDGQLHGVAPASKYNLTKPPGMVYIPPGMFHMGLAMKISIMLLLLVTKKFPLMAFGWMLLKLPITNIASLFTG